MQFVLFVATVSALAGPGASHPYLFKSEEACEAGRARFVQVVKDYNRTAADPVTKLAALCVPLKAFDAKAM